ADPARRKDRLLRRLNGRRRRRAGVRAICGSAAEAEEVAEEIDAAIVVAHAALAVAGADDDDLGADVGAGIEMLHVLVHHADAARRHVLADRPGLVRAVDAEDRVAAALGEIERARAERVVLAAGLGDGQDAALLGLAAAHLGRRRPARPFGLAADLHHARPAEAVAADADAVARRLVVALDIVEILVVRIDDDGAR